MLLSIDKQPKEALAAKDAQGMVLTYGELCEIGQLLQNVMPSHSLLFLLTENNVGGIAWSIGCLIAKQVPLILNAHTEVELYQNLYNTYLPAYVCLPKPLNVLVQGEKVMECYGYVLIKTNNDEYTLHPELSHLLPTSGSTGSPKLVRHKYENIEAAALNIATFFELKSDDRPLLVLPLYYTMGLSIVFSHLKVGATVLITSQSMTDCSFWNFLKNEKATSFTGVPYSFEVLNLMKFYRMDLPHLTLLTQGGGKMPRALNEKFVNYCQEQNKRWIATYGQSEGTARMAWLPAEYAASKMGSIGKAVPNGELLLIDAEGNQIMESNVQGEMCYRGKNVTMGYARKREDLMLGDERGGFLRTGDLAYKDEDGYYYIVGRLGRFLKLFGIRIGLDECEQIIKSKYPIECACVGTDNRMTIYITNEQNAAMVKETLIEKTKLVASVFEVKVINEIPKNEAGKTLYSKLSTN